ncbi:PepSY domain-containing protein [Tetragenococcus solitarius]|uniref:PepSY domain-containing protein n=1 Tax=Tetragenococcus solitarius TaxID=71453 RepID=A0ABP6KKY6_9ENTE|nr:PepSY domain-containing protein [Tetragenococcus solitarius]
MRKALFYIMPFVATLTLAGCTQSEDEQSEQSRSSQTTQSTTTSQTLDSGSTSSQSASSNSEETASYKQDQISVSVADAIQIYQDELPDTDITEINLERSNGKYYYEVEGLDDDTEYELRIDAKNENTEKQETEKLDTNEQDGKKRAQDKVDLTKLLSIQEAAKIATDEAGGGEAVDWKLDKDLKITYWEVEVKKGHNEVEVKINAQSGEVLEVNEED